MYNYAYSTGYYWRKRLRFHRLHQKFTMGSCPSFHLKKIARPLSSFLQRSPLKCSQGERHARAHDVGGFPLVHRPLDRNLHDLVGAWQVNCGWWRLWTHTYVRILNMLFWMMRYPRNNSLAYLLAWCVAPRLASRVDKKVCPMYVHIIETVCFV